MNGILTHGHMARLPRNSFNMRWAVREVREAGWRRRPLCEGPVRRAASCYAAISGLWKSSSSPNQRLGCKRGGGVSCFPKETRATGRLVLGWFRVCEKGFGPNTVRSLGFGASRWSWPLFSDPRCIILFLLHVGSMCFVSTAAFSLASK